MKKVSRYAADVVTLLLHKYAFLVEWSAVVLRGNAANLALILSHKHVFAMDVCVERLRDYVDPFDASILLYRYVFLVE